MQLAIKTQGFPSVLSKLGVQSPLSGPFWSFESTVLPVFQIGSTSIQSQTALITPPGNHLDVASVNPGAATAILTSPNQPAGLYGIQITWSFGNGAANATALLFKIRNLAGSVLRTWSLDTIGQAASSRDFGRGEITLTENLNENDSFFLENLSAIASGTIRCSMKWVRIGDNVFEF